MPQNPVKTTLFVSEVVAGAGVTITPESGTGIVTIAATSALTTTQVGSLVVTGLATISTAQIGTLSATTLAVTGNTALSTTQVGPLTATTIAVPPSGTFTSANGSNVTVTNAAVTANSSIIFTLKTVGGTPGAYPKISTITPGTGFVVVGAASDTSVYNYLIID